MKHISRQLVAAAACGSAFLLLASAVNGQPPAKSPAATSTPPPATPVNRKPDRTTATFGDWILRCETFADATPPKRSCELGQAVRRPGEQTVQAQLAVGRLASGEPLCITSMLPVNVALQTTPKMLTEGLQAISVDLAWMRCSPSGCFASAFISQEAFRKLKASPRPGRVEYRDAGSQEIKLPITFRGFSETLEALGREPAI